MLHSSLCLKHSPRTDLIVLGAVSSFLAFLSCSSAFISSDIETMSFCITTLEESRELYLKIKEDKR